MPPPVQWEACPPQVDPSLSCQRMKTPWTPPDKSPVAFFPKVLPVPGTSQVLLQFSRLHHEGNPDVRYHLIAEADGPVRQAWLQVNPVSAGCFMNAQGLNEGKYLWTMWGDTWDDPEYDTIEGFIAGDLSGTSPPVVVKQPKQQGLGSDWDVSANWIVQKKGPRYVRPWDKPSESTLIHAAVDDPNGALATIVVPVGPRILLGVGQGEYHGISLWSPEKGLQPWQRWSDDFTRGAGNVGTDGKDVVWTYGEGKKPQDEEFPATSVFTAPYATEMTTIEATKRRLRADMGRPADRFYQYAVGCGYAARRYDVGGMTSNLLIVRLSDGQGWKINGKPLGPDNVDWAQALGISCEHVYVGLGTKGSSIRIARIPLASLGPGLPPD